MDNLDCDGHEYQPKHCEPDVAFQVSRETRDETASDECEDSDHDLASEIHMNDLGYESKQFRNHHALPSPARVLLFGFGKVNSLFIFEPGGKSDLIEIWDDLFA